MSSEQPAEVLSDRAQQLLRVLIERYIRDGQPVGSRTLARDSGLDLSPATVRNVMADLEELGFVRAPHTSAGRMPTIRGYRFFVDTLLTVKPLTGAALQRLRSQLELEVDEKEMAESASTLLSGITRLAGVVTLPRHEHAALRRIEFLPLSQRRVLSILVVNEHEVQNRIIQLDRDYSPAELESAANFLNAQFAGKEIAAVRRTIIREMQDARERMDRLMCTAVTMAERVFTQQEETDDEQVLIVGQTNLMQWEELADVDKLREVFEAFDEKHRILQLLDKSLHADGIQIFIGEESGYRALDECSVVAAPYTVDDEVVGVLGVIGPTRMAYDRVIPIVDATARLVSAALKSGG